MQLLEHSRFDAPCYDPLTSPVILHASLSEQHKPNTRGKIRRCKSACYVNCELRERIRACVRCMDVAVHDDRNIATYIGLFELLLPFIAVLSPRR